MESMRKSLNNEVFICGTIMNKPTLVDLDNSKAIKVDLEVIHDDEPSKFDYISTYFFCNDNIFSQCEEGQGFAIIGHIESFEGSQYVIIDVFHLV